MAGMVIASDTFAACTANPKVASVAVGVLHETPAVGYNYHVTQIADLARQMGYKGAHPPLGLYAGTLDYRVNVQFAPNSGTAEQPCTSALALQFELKLVDRIVEVGTGGGCNSDAVTAHYLAHADQDDRLLRRYADLARSRLDSLVGNDTSRFGRNNDSEGTLKSLAQSIIDDLLRNYDADRKVALASADTSDELARLRDACQDGSL